jgi:hypothetical protein
MVVGVRVTVPNDLSEYTAEALQQYKRQRWETIMQMAEDCNRHEAKRALHQYIDAVVEMRRRTDHRKIR